MSTDEQGTKWRRDIVKNFNWLSMAHERYRQTIGDRQTTDGRATAYSVRSRSLKRSVLSLDISVRSFQVLSVSSMRILSGFMKIRLHAYVVCIYFTYFS